MYRNVGHALLISVLDIFEKNPYSRIPLSQYKNMETLRRETGWETVRTDRFRREPGSHQKARKYNDLI